MLASDLINGSGGVRVTLLDVSKATWSDNELVAYLNEALRTTCALKTDAYTRREPIAMAEGTRQELPEGGIEIFDLYENESDSSAVTMVDRGMLDHQNRFWPAATREVLVQHWAADPRDRRRFEVTPPNNGYGSVWALFGAVPDAIALGDEIPLPESYHNALKLFVLAQAYAKNSKRQDLGKQAGHLAEFRQALGLKSQAQAALAPTVARAAGA